MSRREILVTRFGEMQDMIACLSVYDGSALPKKTSNTTHYTDFDKALELR